MIRKIIAIILICTVTGCTTYTPVDYSSLSSGEKVRLTNHYGDKTRVSVAQVNSDGIRGDNMGFYSRDSIVNVEKKQFSYGKTAGLAGGVALAVPVLAFAGLMALLTFGGPLVRIPGAAYH